MLAQVTEMVRLNWVSASPLWSSRTWLSAFLGVLPSSKGITVYSHFQRELEYQKCPDCIFCLEESHLVSAIRNQLYSLLVIKHICMSLLFVKEYVDMLLNRPFCGYNIRVN